MDFCKTNPNQYKVRNLICTMQGNAFCLLHNNAWPRVSRSQTPVALHLVRPCPQGKGAFFLIYTEGTIWTSGGPNEQDFPDKILVFRKHYAMLKAKRNPQSKKQIKTHM